jgi:hypothetical protein
MRAQILQVAMNGKEVGTLYRDGDGAILIVSARLPFGFPQPISSAIFLGLSEQADKIKRVFTMTQCN